MVAGKETIEEVHLSLEVSLQYSLSLKHSDRVQQTQNGSLAYLDGNSVSSGHLLKNSPPLNFSALYLVQVGQFLARLRSSRHARPSGRFAEKTGAHDRTRIETERYLVLSVPFISRLRTACHRESKCSAVTTSGRQ